MFRGTFNLCMQTRQVCFLKEVGKQAKGLNYMILYNLVLQQTSHVCCVSGRSAILTATIQPEMITLRHTNYLVVF